MITYGFNNNDVTIQDLKRGETFIIPEWDQDNFQRGSVYMKLWEPEANKHSFIMVCNMYNNDVGVGSRWTWSNHSRTPVERVDLRVEVVR